MSANFLAGMDAALASGVFAVEGFEAALAAGFAAALAGGAFTAADFGAAGALAGAAGLAEAGLAEAVLAAAVFGAADLLGAVFVGALAAVLAAAFTGAWVAAGFVEADFVVAALVAAALAGAAKVLGATFEFPYLAHAALEPMNAVARIENGRVEVWGGHQMPDIYQAIAANIAGVTPDMVTLHVMKTGGGFGRRAVIDGDVIAEAVAVSKAVGGKPGGQK